MGQFIHSSPALYVGFELFVAGMILVGLVTVAFGTTVAMMWMVSKPWTTVVHKRQRRQAQLQSDDYPARERIDQPYHDGCQCLEVCQRIRHGHHSV